MTRIAVASAAILMSTTALSAGGLDRSGSTIGALFDTGNVVELSFGNVNPSVSGAMTHPLAGELGAGSVAGSYTQLSLSVKQDLTDALSLAVIIDQPYGASISYENANPLYPLLGSTAELDSSAVTALLRYRLNDRFSIHGGLRAVRTSADLTVNATGPTPVALGGGMIPAGTMIAQSYNAEYETDAALGYVIGAAYEIPEIALRVALTYTSETEFSNRAHGTLTRNALIGGGAIPLPGAEFDENLNYTMPQQIALDFQTGIAANTLLMASVRWTEWSKTVIFSPEYFDNPIVNHSDDVISYSIGIGRRFSDSFAGAITVGYEESTGKTTSNLAPTDGQLSLQVGGTYTIGNVELTGGVRYIQIGDATTRPTISAEFTDNDAIAVGLSVAYRF